MEAQDLEKVDLEEEEDVEDLEEEEEEVDLGEEEDVVVVLISKDHLDHKKVLKH